MDAGAKPTRVTWRFCAAPVLAQLILVFILTQRLDVFSDGSAVSVGWLIIPIDGVAITWIFAVITVIAATAPFVAFFDDDAPNVVAWPSIIICGVLMVGTFAYLHAAHGVVCAAAAGCPEAPPGRASPPRVNDVWTALYFSIVTFTTLGYGDFQPGAKLRLLAAFQALYGYGYLGLIVAAAFQSASRGDPSPPVHDAECPHGPDRSRDERSDVAPQADGRGQAASTRTPTASASSNEP